MSRKKTLLIKIDRVESLNINLLFYVTAWGNPSPKPPGADGKRKTTNEALSSDIY